MRNYRPAWLEVGAGGVRWRPRAGAQLEKKIDLPPIVGARLFAGAVGGGAARHGAWLLSPRPSPTFLRRCGSGARTEARARCAFVLEPGQNAAIVIEPWDVVIQERRTLRGGEAREIRIWGRRRLFVFGVVLPHAAKVRRETARHRDAVVLEGRARRATASIWACRAGRKTIGRAARALRRASRAGHGRTATSRKRRRTGRVAHADARRSR